MKFAVEAWAPEYGAAVDQERLEEASGKVDIDVERPAGEWSALDPRPEVAPLEDVVFVDGVRRVDARVWITAGSGTHAGLCASVAAGAVRCQPSGARVVGSRVFRGVYADASVAAGPIATRHGAYEFVPCTSGSPDDLYPDLYGAIHERMTMLEAQIVGDDVDADDADVVVFDGPLRGRTYREGVGFIKTQHVKYLPDQEWQVLPTLRAGQRTPLSYVPRSGGFWG